ncbi:AraC family transcriptional regulator [Rhizobium chutanense]|uniref:AraC family transcriptional regulator n=1 Tax=Rhizobium chutanense TaxID=2035448 RepID=A0A2A6J2K0_9HYPH|nr:AraC family transcriptional regulator [Rhizobium chutanense]PDT00232.1 AraC family transcriptional regulator [Rhizobium chutanense]
MVESLVEIAPFEGSTTDPIEDFAWSADAWSDGTLTLSEMACNRAWHLSATSGTPEWLTIMVPRDGICGITMGQSTTTALPGQLLLGHTHQVDRFFVRGRVHRSEKLHLNWSVISQALGELIEAPVSGSLDLRPQVDQDSPSGLLLKNLVETIISGMRGDGVLLHSPIAMGNLTQALGQLVVQSIPHRYSWRLERKTFMPTPRHVRRAIDFMQANIGEPITMPMVALAANVSVRTLETGFRAFKEATPAAYLRILRLRAARQELLDPSNRQDIKDICLKWGFFHAGRFSATYKSAFGETPQEARRRRRHPFADRRGKS